MSRIEFPEILIQQILVGLVGIILVGRLDVRASISTSIEAALSAGELPRTPSWSSWSFPTTGGRSSPSSKAAGELSIWLPGCSAIVHDQEIAICLQSIRLMRLLSYCSGCPAAWLLGFSSQESPRSSFSRHLPTDSHVAGKSLTFPSRVQPLGFL